MVNVGVHQVGSSHLAADVRDDRAGSKTDLCTTLGTGWGQFRSAAGHRREGSVDGVGTTRNILPSGQLGELDRPVDNIAARHAAKAAIRRVDGAPGVRPPSAHQWSLGDTSVTVSMSPDGG